MTTRRRKPNSLPPPNIVRGQLATLARQVNDLERELAMSRPLLRAAERRAADLAAWAATLPPKYRPRHLTRPHREGVAQ